MSTPEVEEARHALRALYLEVDSSVAHDVAKKVESAFKSLGDER